MRSNTVRRSSALVLKIISAPDARARAPEPASASLGPTIADESEREGETIEQLKFRRKTGQRGAGPVLDRTRTGQTDRRQAGQTRLISKHESRMI